MMIHVSYSGALTARPGSGSYCSSKLTILRWTETLRPEFEDKCLVTYCINPGAIKTKSTEAASGKVRNRFSDRPEIADDTIAWLVAERREWLGGQYMSCPRDMEELMAKKEEIVTQDKLKMRLTF
jgi:short-subunit dehydrogenase